VPKVQGRACIGRKEGVGGLHSSGFEVITRSLIRAHSDTYNLYNRDGDKIVLEGEADDQVLSNTSQRVLYIS